MNKTIFLLLIIASLYSCSTNYKNPHVRIETRQGDIELELYPDQAPQSVAAFLSYVDSGFYKNASFYRVLNTGNQSMDAAKAELIQGGLYRSKIRPNLKGIPHETTDKTKILHKNGTVSLARVEPGSATTEFFICVGDQPGFDYGGENNPDKQGYAAFGKVVKGMDVVMKIYSRNESGQYFDPPIDIYNIKRL